MVWQTAEPERVRSHARCSPSVAQADQPGGEVKVTQLKRRAQLGAVHCSAKLSAALQETRRVSLSEFTGGQIR